MFFVFLQQIPINFGVNLAKDQQKIMSPKTCGTNLTSKIVVTGVGGPAGRASATYLRKRGYTVIGTDMRPVDTPVDLFHTVPPANHPDFMTALQGIVREHKASLLIPTVQEELPIIAKDCSIISSTGCMAMIASYPAVVIANDKLLTAQHLALHNVEVPGTLDGDTQHKGVIEKLGLPLIAKPRVSRGGRGISLYNTPEELSLENRKGIIYQQFMPGQEFDANLYIDRQGAVRSCVVLAKTQLKDGIVGNALSVERVSRQDVADLAIRTCKTVGLTGPVDMDIRIDAAGIPRLLEINARIGANMLFAEETMENLLADWQSFINLKGEQL